MSVTQTGKRLLERVLHGLSWRLPLWLFHYDHTYLVNAHELKLPCRDYQQYEIREATLDDVGAIVKEGVKEELVRERLERGDYGVIVQKGERVVAWSWSARGRLFVPTGGIRIDTGEDGFFLYNVFTAPEERLKGLILLCFRQQLEHNNRQGYYKILGTISAFNTGSLRTHLRMGLRICGETFGVKVAGISMCYYKSWPQPTRKVQVFVGRPAGGLKSV